MRCTKVTTNRGSKRIWRESSEEEQKLENEEQAGEKGKETGKNARVYCGEGYEQRLLNIVICAILNNQ